MTSPTAGSRHCGRIARLLGVEATEVIGLDDISEADLAILHDQISNALFADGHTQFANVAGLSKMLPGSVAGKLAEKFLPPVLAARVAELLEPNRARDLVTRVSVRYLGDLSLVLDPVRSKPVVQAIPAPRVGEVARELFDRGEYAAMAEFVGTVTVDALFAALGAATPRDLLAVVPLLEWNDNLDHVIANLPAEQVTGIVAELDPVELADLALALDPSRFGPIVHAVPVETVQAIAAELFQRGEYAGMAAFVGVVTPDMLHAALGVASGHDLLAVVPLLEWNANLDHVIATAAVAQIDGVFEAMIADDLWAQGSELMDQLTPEAQQHLLSRVGELSETNFAALQAAAAADKLSAKSRELVDAATRRRTMAV
ncbi:MAG: hypothetical protein ABR571_16820 [Jatrophihabitans sp.]|uniref:hypothetical protein n=1 Tax=Jatrophihabitans sp. TaxID=1932789 RepID=UPI00390DB07F